MNCFMDNITFLQMARAARHFRGACLRYFATVFRSQVFVPTGSDNPYLQTFSPDISAAAADAPRKITNWDIFRTSAFACRRATHCRHLRTK